MVCQGGSKPSLNYRWLQETQQQTKRTLINTAFIFSHKTRVRSVYPLLSRTDKMNLSSLNSLWSESYAETL